MWERKNFVFRRKKFQKHKKYVYFNKSLACQRSSKRPLQIALQTKSQMNFTFNGIIVRNVLIPQDFLQHGLSFGLPAWVFKGFILNFAFLIMWPPRPLWAQPPHLPYFSLKKICLWLLPKNNQYLTRQIIVLNFRKLCQKKHTFLLNYLRKFLG